MKLRPFFHFYGGKWRAAPHYPPPKYGTIVEPFAGSAGYSMRYPDRRVILVERDPKIAATWRYLLSASPAEILALPDIGMDQTVDDLDVCDAARYLIGWRLNAATSQPRKTPGAWMRSRSRPGNFWGPKIRHLIASQLPRIKHWTLIEGDCMQVAPGIEATWFVDPPYEKAGKHYKFGSEGIDFAALGLWCRARQGQTIVCENVGADWLPFRPWRDILATPKKDGGKVSREAIWLGTSKAGAEGF